MDTRAERDLIYRLRYRAYLKEGAIEPNPDHKITDRFDDMPNSWIFGVYLDGVLASSIRLSISSPESPLCPSVEVFQDYLQPEVDQGKVMVDPTRFVADPEIAGRFPELPYLTLRLCFVACSFFHADLGLATVRAEHEPPPNLEGASHWFASASLRHGTHPVDRIVGDLLVLEESAVGPARGPDGSPLEGTDTAHFPGVDHLVLCNHPAVYAQLRQWVGP